MGFREQLNECTDPVSGDWLEIKIGKLVYASCEIRLSAKGSSIGAAKITGLPATSATTAAGGVPTIIWFQMATNFVNVSGGVDSAATTITLVGYTAAAASYASLTNSDFANNSILQITVMYEAA